MGEASPAVSSPRPTPGRARGGRFTSDRGNTLTARETPDRSAARLFSRSGELDDDGLAAAARRPRLAVDLDGNRQLDPQHRAFALLALPSAPLQLFDHPGRDHGGLVS